MQYIPSTETELSISALQGNEGLGEYFIAPVSYELFVMHFPVADIEIDEIDKMQRDPTASRKNKIVTYLTQRSDTTFPSVTCVVTKANFEALEFGSNVGKLTIPTNSQRILIDGQGRRLGIGDYIELVDSAKTRTIDVKFILTNTDSLEEASTMIKQIFADYHKNVMKPTSSINMLFDNAETASSFVKKAYHVLEDLGIHELVSLHGKSDKVWTLAQFKTFLRRFTGMSDMQMNKTFLDSKHEQLWLLLVKQFFNVLMASDVVLPLSDQESINLFKKNNIIGCAIGLEALGMFGADIVDSALMCNQEPNFELALYLKVFNFDKESNSAFRGRVISTEGKMIKGSAPALSAIFSRYVTMSQMNAGS